MTLSRTVLAAVFSAAMMAGCGDRAREATNPVPDKAPVDARALLEAAIESDIRPETDRTRDRWRHPRETLEFFAIEPTMTVIEVWPGAGWYTRILGPYLSEGGGVYRAALVDPSANARAAEAIDRFKSAFSDQDRFGEVEVITIESAEPGAADVVLTFRNVHNWIVAGVAERNFKAFYAALKPGGVLGVVEHRANENAADEIASGYVKESTVRALAADAGFESVASSEINANPADTKDHPFGVWTLPPTRRSSASPGQENPMFDRAKYDAIGESDRMTLKFAKPRS